ncbi:hypothetical protein NDI56_16295 [Haloarcula sp. S1CR25-12]|uniref:ABC transporter permease n=1 Tax=Haloarcula saliterrae TaxID=2950534 RepID=A0ABU2FFD0_9EURY|nr:hypothetical protein [Haloarcula sp. S1CR25-12]
MFGAEYAATGQFTALGTARGVAGMAFLVVLFFVVTRELRGGERAGIDEEMNLLLASPREIVVAKLLMHTGTAVRFVGTVLAAGSISFALGAGSPVVALGLLAGSALLIVSAVAVAFPVAVGTQYSFKRFESVRKRRRLLGGTLTLGFATMFVMARRAVLTFSSFPLGWYADLGFILVTDAVSLTHSFVVVAILPLALAFNLTVVSRIGELSWLTEPGGDGLGTETRSSDGIEPKAVEMVVSQATAAGITTTWRRVYRNPNVLMYSLMFIPILGVAILPVLNTAPSVGLSMVAITGAAIVGLGPTLNPIGNEGAFIQVPLMTPQGCRHLLAGLICAVALPGVLLVSLATVIAGILLDVSVSVVAGSVTIGVILVIVSSVSSAAVGILFPQYEGTSIVRNRGMQAPQTEAVMIYLLAIFGLGLPTVYGLQMVPYISTATGISQPLTTLSVLVVTALAAAIVSVGSWRYGLGKLQALEID